MQPRDANRLVEGIEELVRLTRGKTREGLILLPFGTARIPDRYEAAPYDYMTVFATAPQRCRARSLVIPSSIASQVSVRHLLLGEGRIAQFHGGDLPGLLFFEGRSDIYQWGILEKDEKAEMNITGGAPGEIFQAVLLAEPLAEE